MSDRISIGDVEDRKLKRRMEEPPAMDEDLEELLTLRLGSNSSKSLKISEESGSGVGSGEGNTSPKPVQPLTPRDHHEQEVQAVEPQYSCKYCNKKFTSTQALGGHQNAHRRERVITKKLENDKFELGGMYRYGRSNSNMYPYSISMGNNALQLGASSSLYHGSQFNSIGHVSSPSMTWTNGSAVLQGGHGDHGGLEGNPNVISFNNASSDEEIDLELKL
ncbi:Zinc finger C2H2-type [Sesbania bispinosa]|nr:Zinc finger C2H2-type [Sesbania bispinosa]